MSTDFSTMEENLSSDRDPRPCRILAAAVDGKFRILYREGEGVAGLDEIHGEYSPFAEFPEDGIVVWEGCWEHVGFGSENDPELLGQWRHATPEEWAAYLKDEFVWEVWFPPTEEDTNEWAVMAKNAVRIEGHSVAEDPRYLYAVTTIVTDGKPILNCVCKTFERAKKIIETNEGDLEERWTHFAIIEKFCAGVLYQWPEQYWYVWVEGDWDKSAKRPPKEYGKFMPVETPLEVIQGGPSAIF